MRILSFYLWLFCTIWFTGCSSSHESFSFEKGGGGTETIGVDWKGSQSKAPVNPDTNCAYKNSVDNISYIWSGYSWDTLALNGDATISMQDFSKVSLKWLGEKSEAPASPVLYSAYYDRELKGAFIWDSTSWSILSIDTDVPRLLGWKGVFATAPTAPEIDWTYYNTTEKKSYRYNGSDWELVDKADFEEMEKNTTATIQWQGSLVAHPINPEVNWLYINKSDNNTYIYTGMEWEIFASYTYGNELIFLDGMGLHWKGNSNSSPVDPMQDWAYYDSRLHTCFQWNKGVWTILFIDPSNEIFLWQGAFPNAPDSPGDNWAYYNTVDKKSYIYSSDQWEPFTIEDMDTEVNGSPIVWMGSYSYPPSQPVINSMFYGSEDGITYIFDGANWSIFATHINDSIHSGLNGVTVEWLGNFDMAPQSPISNSAFYDTANKASFIWSGSEWNVLYLNDTTFGCFWQDASDSAPTDPFNSLLYFNTTEMRSYMFTNNTWKRFTREDIVNPE